VDIREVQRRAWDNKIAKGFNMTDVALEFGLLTAEIGEAFTAWRKHLHEFGEELADVAIYRAGIAQMNGIDLADEVERKLAINERRTTAATITAAASEHDQPLRTASRRLAAPRRLGLTMPLIAVTGHMNLTPLTQKLIRSGIHELLAKAPGWAHRHHVPGQGCRPDLRSRSARPGRHPCRRVPNGGLPRAKARPARPAVFDELLSAPASFQHLPVRRTRPAGLLGRQYCDAGAGRRAGRGVGRPASQGSRRHRHGGRAGQTARQAHASRLAARRHPKLSAVTRVRHWFKATPASHERVRSWNSDAQPPRTLVLWDVDHTLIETRA